jgi:hypothetical protein
LDLEENNLMNKSPLLAAILCSLVTAATMLVVLTSVDLPVRAQDYIATQSQTFAWVGRGLIIRTAGSSTHQLTWRTIGDPPTVCTMKLEQTSDGVIFTDLISESDCTANGSSALAAGNPAYLSVSVTAYTGTGTLAVTWTGYTAVVVRQIIKAAKQDTTSIAAGLFSDVVVTWPSGFPDATYKYSCGVLDISAPGLGLRVDRVRAFDASSITVQVMNSAAITALTGTVHCIGVWP